jgi:hypothetical protein
MSQGCDFFIGRERAMDYEKAYKELIETFRTWLIETCQFKDEIEYYKTASDNSILNNIFDIMEYAVRPQNSQAQAIQFEIMRKAFSR